MLANHCLVACSLTDVTMRLSCPTCCSVCLGQSSCRCCRPLIDHQTGECCLPSRALQPGMPVRRLQVLPQDEQAPPH